MRVLAICLLLTGCASGQFKGVCGIQPVLSTGSVLIANVSCRPAKEE